MKTSELHYDYPAHLVATEKDPVSRVMMVKNEKPMEICLSDLFSQMNSHDCLVINDTKVIPARVCSESGMEILFIRDLGKNHWEVLCPARKWPGSQVLKIPGGVEVSLVQKGSTQVVEVSRNLDAKYFLTHGQIPLPPYIQEARKKRHPRPEDRKMYQSQWAKTPGSLAAPTASLHFSMEDLQKIQGRGTLVKSLSLHIGIGTFLPIRCEHLEDHKMHSEFVSIPMDTWEAVENCKKSGGCLWALGSTVTRALESVALGLLEKRDGVFYGTTNLFIKPGFEFQVVNTLMTNFHRPESTLLAMVMAFAGVENVRKNYQWAINRNFRLFSYGDLSLWQK